MTLIFGLQVEALASHLIDLMSAGFDPLICEWYVHDD